MPWNTQTREARHHRGPTFRASPFLVSEAPTSGFPFHRKANWPFAKRRRSGLIPSRRLRPVNPRSGSVRQGAGSTRGAFAGGAHFIGREACEAEPGIVDAIIAVRAHFDRPSMAFVGKQLLRHHAAEFAILADIAEAVQIQPFSCLAGAVHMCLQT